MRWSRLFVGRKSELDILKEAYDNASRGNPRVVSFIAESGFGKTRLIQEFYNWLSTERDGVEDNGYWPDFLERVENNLTVNPPPNECGLSMKPMPFLWWGIRIPDPGARNEVVSGALWPAVSILTPHLARQKQAVERDHLQRTAQKTGAAGAADAVFEIAGSFVTFGLLGVGRAAVTRGKEFYDLRRQMRALDAQDLSPSAVAEAAEDSLSETILADLRRLSSTPIDDTARTPLVIFIDDAQWISKDEGTRAFAEELLQTARSENWPLLVVLTCWEKEWNESLAAKTLPGSAVEEPSGDKAILLGRAEGLDEIAKLAFPGLLDTQLQMLIEKADGNPRFLDEVLMFLDRNPKFFEKRNQDEALSRRGKKAISDMGFADLVIDRLEAAPDYVRRILGLASLQGTLFSTRITQHMARECGFDQSEQGISESEDPFGFVSLDWGKQTETDSASQCLVGGEFRLRVYREAAHEDLENYVDLDEALRHFAISRERLVEDLEIASDIDLAILMEFVEEAPEQAFLAAAAMIERSNERHDTRNAGEIGERFWLLLSQRFRDVSAKTISTILGADVERRGYKEEHRDLLKNCLDNIQQTQEKDGTLKQYQENLAELYKAISGANLILSGALTAKPSAKRYEQLMRGLADELRTPKARENLANAVFSLGSVIGQIDGPEAQKPYLVECEQLMRGLADELKTPKAREILAIAVFSLGGVIGQIDGPEAQKPYFVEHEQLMRGLADELKTPEARQNLANAVAHLGEVIGQIDGPKAQKPYFVEHEQLMRGLADELKTPNARQNLAQAVARLGKVIGQIDGPEAQKPYLVECEQLRRGLADELKTPNARQNLAIAVFHLGSIIGQIDGPKAQKPYSIEHEQLMRGLADELKTPNARQNLAHTVAHLGNVIGQIDGPEAQKPCSIEHEQLMRGLADELKTPEARENLAHAVAHLGEVIGQIDGPKAQKPYSIEHEQLMRGLADELKTPEARKNLANAVAHLGGVIGQIDGPEAQKPYLVECVQLTRRLADELKTPNARQNLAHAVAHLGEVIGQIDGPEAQKPYSIEHEQLMRGLADELKTPNARENLAKAVFFLGGVIGQIDGPEAQKPNLVECVQLTRRLADELKTPNARQNLAHAVAHLGEVIGQIDGPEAQKPYSIEHEQLMRGLADELKTPDARKKLALAVFHLGSIIGQIDGPEAQKPYSIEHEQLMRGLADELKTPNARQNLANAVFHLGSVIGQIDGPEAQKPYLVEYEQLKRGLADELKTPNARQNLAHAVFFLGEVIGQIDGPEAQKPYSIEHEQLMRGLADELKTPNARENLANAVAHLGGVIGQIDGPEAQKPYSIEHEQLMRGLADELKTPDARRKLALAVFFLGEVIGQIDGPDVQQLYFGECEQILQQNKTKEDRIDQEQHILDYINFRITSSALLTKQGWSRAFALEIIQNSEASVHLAALQGMVSSIESFCERRPYHPNAQRRLVEACRQLASCQYVLGDNERALATIAAGFLALEKVGNQLWIPALRSKIDLLFAQGRTHHCAGQLEPAISCFDIARASIATLPDQGIYPMQRLRAALAWFHTDCLLNQGDTVRAKQIFIEGYEAAQEFARFNAMDGPAILVAYREHVLSKDPLS